MQNPKLSVVILSYQSLPLLPACLNSIYKYNDIGDFLEVIVTDNASTNQKEIGVFLSESFPKVKFIPNPENLGYGAGNNIGIKACKSKFVMLMNPDVTLHEPVFSWALDTFGRDENQALLGFKQKDQHSKDVHSFLMRRLTISNFWMNWLYQKMNRFNANYSVISGPCFFLNRNMFLAAGAYDENIFLYGEERLLHEKIRRFSVSAKISMDFTKSYVHPISHREFSLKTVQYGLKSYFYLQKLLCKPREKTFAEVLRYYRFLEFFYRIKSKKEAVNQTKLTINLLKGDFK